MRFRELVTIYSKHARVRLRKRTWLNRASLLRALDLQLGQRGVDAITEDEIDDYASARLDAGLRRVSVNNELRALRRVLNFARSRRLVRRVVHVELLCGEDERRVQFWTVDQVTRLLAAIALLSPAILPIVLCIANTGCRAGEALALKWSRVNLERGLIEFWPSEEWRPKSGRPREVPISDELRALLDRLPRSSQYVFPASTGKRWAYWPQLQFDRAREAAGIEGGPHTLRHTYASIFLSRVPDLPLLGQLLGHTDARVTRLYAHLLPDHLERARNVVQFAPPEIPPSGRNTGGAKKSIPLRLLFWIASATRIAKKSLTESLNRSINAP